MMEKQEQGGRENTTPATVIGTVFDQIPLSLPMDLLQPQAPREAGGRCSGNFGLPPVCPSCAIQIALCPSSEKNTTIYLASQ